MTMMKDPIFVIAFMIFLHIINDFCLQGWMAEAKQKKYWEKNAPGKMYKNDYIWVLMMHSFSWSFMILIPLILINYSSIIIYLLIINTIIHLIVDDMKANRLIINLWVDQIIHILQIILSYLAFQRFMYL